MFNIIRYWRMQRKTTFIKMAQIKNSDNAKCWLDYLDMDHSHTVGM